MIVRIQPFLKALGEWGCYILSIFKIVELETKKPVPVLETAYMLQGKGALGEDAFVADANAVITTLLSSAWEVVKAGLGHPLPASYRVKPGEYEILRFERANPKGGEPLAHFVLGAGDGVTCEWDPWPNSATVQYGTVASRRIVRRK